MKTKPESFNKNSAKQVTSNNPKSLTGNKFAERQKLIKDNMKLVQQVVNKFLYAKGTDLEEDDLIGYGTVGLIEAADKFEIEKGKNFAAFATPRIKGAILDQLRVNDCLSRGARKRVKQLSACISELEIELGHTPTNLQIAEKMQIGLDDLNKIQKEATVSTFSLDTNLAEDTEGTWLDQVSDSRPTPDQDCEDNNFRENLIKAIDLLPERERLVIGLYHYRNLTMREIAAVLKVSESRACQIHNRAVSLLRSKLEELYGNNI